MKKIIFFSLIGVAIIVFVQIAIFGFSISKIHYITTEIEKANYCNVKEDCINVGGKCPFGCFAYVNKNEAGRIQNLIASIKSSCIYSCMDCPDVECKNNKCESICK